MPKPAVGATADAPVVRKWRTWMRLTDNVVTLDDFRALFPAALVERALVTYARKNCCLVRT